MTPGIAIIIYYSSISFATCLSLINEAKYYLKEDSDNRLKSCNKSNPQPSHFPEWYRTTPEWIKKYIWPADTFIPKFLYYEIVLGLVRAALGPINIFVSFILKYKYILEIGLCHLSVCACTRIIVTILFRKIWK